MGCRGILALVPGAAPAPPAALPLLSAGLFLSYSHSSLQLLFCSFLCPSSVIPEVMPLSLMGSGCIAELLAPSDMGQLLAPAHRSHLLSPATRTWPHKLIQKPTWL